MSSVAPSDPHLGDGENGHVPHGEFCDFAGERYYAIQNVERIAPFFVSVVSADDHWLFASSTGGLTAGRVSPETALFPYETVDKLHESGENTGPKTLVRVQNGSGSICWEPFRRGVLKESSFSRNLYKNTLGNKLCYEEINHDLELAFRYTWATSAEYGFVRSCELVNLGREEVKVEVLDGLQNILPAGTPRFTQTNSSNLVDAYKWTELDEDSGLAFLTLYSGISDRAEPSESLKATTIFSLGLKDPTILLSSNQIDAFRLGKNLTGESRRRGIRGAYFVHFDTALTAGKPRSWQMVLDNEQCQADAVRLRNELTARDNLSDRIQHSIAEGSEHLASIMASADAFQSTSEENVSVHHYANVLFNVLRGGVFDDGYSISSQDFRSTIRHFNMPTYERNRAVLDALPKRLRVNELLDAVGGADDAQLRRLALEYLPITFGRRHGDPSRPWNQFAILLKDEFGDDLLSYQGNWRDIFQNWEALAFSYPAFIENMIAKFVNASTIDGYNPYRITKEGIDWEVEEPDNPWSYIGYWGDHQVIYLLKLLELSQSFHPDTLQQLLTDKVFCYANVPYRIKPLEQIVEHPKDTVVFDDDLALAIEQRVAELGADGKLVLGDDNDVYLVNLFEKLLVTLLAKLGNLVVDGGIWLNTQRPEWNDANNALVGQGLSMVTLYYLRRYVCFLQRLLADAPESFEISSEVAEWQTSTATALSELCAVIGDDKVDDEARLKYLLQLGRSASDYREKVYAQGRFSAASETSIAAIRDMLDDALVVVDRSISTNRRDDGMFHAYNIADFGDDALAVETLYPMLEGQVAALSSGAISVDEAVAVLEALYDSSVYREDQNSFMLYPDRELPGFLERNQVSEAQARAIPLLERMLADGDDRIVLRDADGCIRFNADFRNASDVRAQLDTLNNGLDELAEESRQAVLELYESVFHHKHFTGRSGTMFGFEGLGSIYWHMVSKLMLAAVETYFVERDKGADEDSLHRLGELYYRVRSGIGFNKTPAEYGAFPTDPYSHTPRHAGARQPGMTGQVKEEVLTRFAELGVRVVDGCIRIEPVLLRRQEFRSEPGYLCFLAVDGEWRTIDVPATTLAFTWCQVPFVYAIDGSAPAGVRVEYSDGHSEVFADFALPERLSRQIFEKSGAVRRIDVSINTSQLFDA